MKIAIITIVFTTLALIVPSAAAQRSQNQVSVGIRQETAVPAFGIKIKFLDVIEDSRCPAGRECIWAGNAKVRISVRSGNQKPLVLEVNSTVQPQVVNYGRYEIRLAGLDPKPAADNVKAGTPKYVATFTIRKLVK